MLLPPPRAVATLVDASAPPLTEAVHALSQRLSEADEREQALRQEAEGLRAQLVDTERRGQDLEARLSESQEVRAVPQLRKRCRHRQRQLAHTDARAQTTSRLEQERAVMLDYVEETAEKVASLEQQLEETHQQVQSLQGELQEASAEVEQSAQDAQRAREEASTECERYAGMLRAAEEALARERARARQMEAEAEAERARVQERGVELSNVHAEAAALREVRGAAAAPATTPTTIATATSRDGFTPVIHPHDPPPPR